MKSYNSKYPVTLNLAVWPQTKNILAEFNIGISGSFTKEHRCLSLEVLEQSHQSNTR